MSTKSSAGGEVPILVSHYAYHPFTPGSADAQTEVLSQRSVLATQLEMLARAMV